MKINIFKKFKNVKVTVVSESWREAVAASAREREHIFDTAFTDTETETETKTTTHAERQAVMYVNQ